MERLKGKTILIGREHDQSRLLIAIQGNGKNAATGSPGSVPASVSRCKPAEGMAHAKISVDQSGNMVLTNMKSQNVTFVNGHEIASKRVSLSDTIELGKDKFNINLSVVIETAKKILSVAPSPQPLAKKFNISHLEWVWNDYHDKVIEIRRRQKQQGVYASLPMFCTLGAGVLGFVLSNILDEEYKGVIQALSGILGAIGLVLLAFSFIKRKNDTSIEDLEELSEEFQDRYVCPNPDCNKFLGNISYKLLKKQYSMHCPYCRSEFVEK